MKGGDQNVPPSGRPPEISLGVSFTKKIIRRVCLRDHIPEVRHKTKRIVESCLLVAVMTVLLTVTAWGCCWPTDNNPPSKTRLNPPSKIRPNPTERSRNGPMCQWDVNIKTLTCQKPSIPENVSVIVQELQNVKSQGLETVGLVLQEAIFSDNTVSPGWLPLTPSQPSIDFLSLSGVSIKQLEDNWLTDFTALDSLTISSTSISFFKKETLEGPIKLTKLNLDNNLYFRQVEKGLLQSGRITTLQLQDSDFSDLERSNEFFYNLTGDGMSATMAILDLRFNIIPTLTTSVLAGYTNIKSLYLTGNGLQSIDRNAFHTALTVEQIFLDNNGIKDLPESTFGVLVRKGTAIYLKNNRLNCTCDMAWLQNYILQVDHNKVQYKAFLDVTCTTPDELFNVPFLSAPMCLDVSTTPPPETTPTTTTTSSTEQPSTTENTTQEPTTNSTNPTENTTQETTTTSSTTEIPGIGPPCNNVTEFPLHLSNNKSKFRVDEDKKTGGTKVSISSVVSDPLPLIWFCTHCTFFNCNYIHNNSVTIADLTPDTDYIFCLYDNKSTEGRECLAHQTRPSPGNETWLIVSDMAYALPGVVIGLIAMFAIGGGLSFFIIRKRPTLLKGSGRVEVVKARNKDVVLVMPEKCSNNVIYNSDGSNQYEEIQGYVSVGSSSTPPPPPPYPPGWRERIREKGEDYVVLEPPRLMKPPKNLDLLVEYEWHTLQQLRRISFETIGSDISSVDGQ